MNVPTGVIERVDIFEYLGLVVDSELSFKHHTRKVTDKIKPYVAILSRLKYYLPVHALKSIYYAYIHSVIIYLLPAYGSCAKTFIDELNMLHKKASRMSLNSLMITLVVIFTRKESLMFTY